MREIMVKHLLPWWEDFQRLFALVPGGVYYQRSAPPIAGPSNAKGSAQTTSSRAMSPTSAVRLDRMQQVLRKVQSLTQSLLTSSSADKTASQAMLSLSSVSCCEELASLAKRRRALHVLTPLPAGAHRPRRLCC